MRFALRAKRSRAKSSLWGDLDLCQVGEECTLLGAVMWYSVGAPLRNPPIKKRGPDWARPRAKKKTQVRGRGPVTLGRTQGQRGVAHVSEKAHGEYVSAAAGDGGADTAGLTRVSGGRFSSDLQRPETGL